MGDVEYKQVEISTEGLKTTVLIDGEPIDTMVTNLSLTLSARDIPRLQLEAIADRSLTYCGRAAVETVVAPATPAQLEVWLIEQTEDDGLEMAMAKGSLSDGPAAALMAELIRRARSAGE